MKKIYFLVGVILLAAPKLFAQVVERATIDTIKTIHIDSVINITRGRLTAEDFIREVVNDTSFYKAFRMMKKYEFIAENSLYSYDKQNKVTGSMYRKIKHSNDTKGHNMQYLAQNDSGELKKKNGKYKLTTVEMFDYIFMNAYNSDFVPNAEVSSVKGIGSNEGIKDKLKTLIFNPGRPIKGVPFISNKTQIFSANMRQYYDYTFYRGNYLDSIPVYWFKVTVKPDLTKGTKDGLMIKELTTLFDARNFNILGRAVDMKLNNFAFDFDVKMNIEMAYFGEEKLPTKISYQGNWDIPLKKEEKVSFLVLHKDYKLE
ncbi:hypothetical protein [Pedobacter flavus]|uniref:Uncharacterized protein n=1 Tax=Pedobacter flavus TaxID=3113906 RepID=A0ABU7GYW3_9SPHI|nr:hypothetical protein [Pedobacter sp. VNH31]MEE1884181.1 hypothetical protein [Pedobacter sp. VNH31]